MASVRGLAGKQQKPIPENPKTMGEIIRRARCDQGLSQAALAERSQCCLREIAHIESSFNMNIKRGTLIGVASSLRLVINPLLLLKPDKFGKTLRQKREAMGLARESLAQACQCTQATIKNVEAGKYYPQTSTFEKIARVLGFEHRVILLGLDGKGGIDTDAIDDKPTTG